VLNLTLRNSKRIQYDEIDIVKGIVWCVPTDKGHRDGGNMLPYQMSSDQSWLNVHRMTNDPDASYNVSVDCGHVRDHRIGINYLGNMTCPGDAYGKLVYECPGRVERPICSFWNGITYEQDPTCYVEAYSEYETVCICNQSSLPLTGKRSSTRSRRLSSGLISTSTEFTSISATYDTDMNWQYIKKPRFVFKIIPNAFIVSITTGLLFLLVVGVITFLGLDANYDMAKRKAKLLAAATETAETSPLKIAFNNLIPLEFSFRPWMIRYKDAIKLNHVWYGVLNPPLPPSKTFGDNTEYRSAKWIMAIFRITM